MRLSLGHIDVFDARTARYAHQLGLKTVQLHNPANLLPAEHGYWSVEALTRLRAECENAGLLLEGLENVPAEHYWRIPRGLPGRDEQIENYQRTIRNMAEAGITLLGYNFMATYVWRTDMHARGRGDARTTAFDVADAPRGNALSEYKLTPVQPLHEPLDDAAMWANYRYFLDAVLPVAEEVGVRLALHPDDPPVSAPLGGAAHIFRSPEALEEADRLSNGSPAWGLNFCIGTVSEMGGAAAVERVISTLGAAGRIRYVHFRDVHGTVPAFVECFLGEGNLHPPGVIRQLADAGFDGFIIDDHVPAMEGDLDTWLDTSSEAYCSRGRAHAIGYLQGVLDALGYTSR